MRQLLTLLAAFALFTGQACHAETSGELLAIGKGIYHEGIGAAGNSIVAAVRGDVTMQGKSLACVNCHRRSGFGSSESRVVIPPISGDILFTRQRIGLDRDYRNGHLGNIERPAYTATTLAHVLREGVDSSGRKLVPMMPRYRFSDLEVDGIAAYLNTLSSSPSPGISDREIHFATVITPDIDAAKRKALNAIFDAYITDKNANTRNESRRAGHAPVQKKWAYSSYRKWVMHAWELHGPESTWGAQLDKYYNEYPVFAVLGGIGGEQWQAVHDYCESNRLPCLFPHIAMPPRQQQNDFYSIYFSPGLRLEAQTLVADLGATEVNSILQIRRSGTAEEASRELTHLTATKKINTVVDEVVIDRKARLEPAFIDLLLELKRPEILVLWLEEKDVAALDLIAASLNRPRHIYLSSTLLPDSSSLVNHPLSDNIRLLHPYLLPGQERKLQRFHTWARRTGVEIVDPRLQADAYFAATLAGEALGHIRSSQTREYFIERIEHMTDTMVDTSYYPRLALAPGQRYAAKGAYVWELNQPSNTARWIVP